MRRFWTILANSNGSMLNYSELGRAFELSDVAVRRYVEVLEGTLMVRVLKPWHENINKRQVKRPKVFVRDTGLLHILLGLSDITLSTKLGASWESFVIEQVINYLSLTNPMLTEDSFYFWRSSTDEEIDLFFKYEGKNYGIEVKYSNKAEVTKSLKASINYISLEKVFIINGGAFTGELISGVFSVSINDIPTIQKILNE